MPMGLIGLHDRIKANHRLFIGKLEFIQLLPLVEKDKNMAINQVLERNIK